MFSVAELISEKTKEEILAKGLEFAAGVGLDVASWHPGDPTKSLYGFLAEQLEVLEKTVSKYARTISLESAKGDWLKLVAVQLYEYTPREATYATTPVVLTNTQGGYYPIEVGDLVFTSSFNKKTYRNTTGGILQSGPGTSLTVTVVADEPGKESDAAAGEIDTLVTTLTGVTCSNPEAAIALDAEDETSIKKGCREANTMLSPAGPKGIYAYVATTPELSTVPEITRAIEVNEGNLTTRLYIATAQGTASAGACTTIGKQIATLAQPAGATVYVESATALLQSVTATVWVYDDIPDDDATVINNVKESINTALSNVPIGGSQPVAGGAKYLIKSQIRGAIKDSYPEFFFKEEVSIPADDIEITDASACVIGGTHTITVVRVKRQ